MDQLLIEVLDMIITWDPLTWRAMRTVAKWHHQRLSWDAYVDKFTVVRDRIRDEKVVGREWLLDNKLHREHDRPAVVCFDGVRGWYRYGLFVRNNGKPAIISHDGVCQWFRWYHHERKHNRPDIAFANGHQSRGLYIQTR
jgi:hypothetical protein